MRPPHELHRTLHYLASDKPYTLLDTWRRYSKDAATSNRAALYGLRSLLFVCGFACVPTRGNRLSGFNLPALRSVELAVSRGDVFFLYRGRRLVKIPYLVSNTDDLVSLILDLDRFSRRPLKKVRAKTAVEAESKPRDSLEVEVARLLDIVVDVVEEQSESPRRNVRGQSHTSEEMASVLQNTPGPVVSTQPDVQSEEKETQLGWTATLPPRIRMPDSPGKSSPRNEPDLPSIIISSPGEASPSMKTTTTSKTANPGGLKIPQCGTALFETSDHGIVGCE